MKEKSKSERLRAFRLAASTTQKEAALVCHTSEKTWIAWESGNKDVPEAIIHLFCLISGQKYDGKKGYDDAIPEVEPYYEKERQKGNKIAGDPLSPNEKKEHEKFMEKMREVQQTWGQVNTGKGRPPPRWLFEQVADFVLKNSSGILSIGKVVELVGKERDSVVQSLKKRLGTPTDHIQLKPGGQPEAVWDCRLLCALIGHLLENEIREGRMNKEDWSKKLAALKEKGKLPR